MHIIAHFKTVNRHRRLVRKNCFRLGLYWQGLSHDLSKYYPIEFLVGARYFQGDHSPNDEQRRQEGYSVAWLHHKGRNRHHFEYWTDYVRGQGIQPVEMPVKYVAEMICDRIAASRVYRGDAYTDADPYAFFLRSQDHVRLHPQTHALLEELLLMLRDKGELETMAHIRKHLL